MAKKWLIFFNTDSSYCNFKLAEFTALLRLSDVSNERIEKIAKSCDGIKGESLIFLIIDALDDDGIAKLIMERSILIKVIIELWSHADSIANIITDLKQLISSSYEPIMRCTESESKSWSFHIQTFYHGLNPAASSRCRDLFHFIPFSGPVNINGPDNEIWLVLDYFTNGSKKSHCIDSSNFNEMGEDVSFNSVPAYVGRVLATNGSTKDLLKKYDLKRRRYLGPTSLDHSLAFILANLAGARKQMIALDPFVGTGSILVSLAHFGVLCYGFDIDIRVLKGQMHAGREREGESAENDIESGTRRDIYENFKQYGLQPPNLIRLDNHLINRHLHLKQTSSISNSSSSSSSVTSVEEGIRFDIIVTDPPYGIRAGARKSGRKKDVTYKVDEATRHTHVPSTQTYQVNEVMLDLLHTSALLLKVDGLLVYVLPTPYSFTAGDLPTHPCFELLEVCEQRLSTRHGRHVVVLRKVRPYTYRLQDEFAGYCDGVMSGGDELFGKLMIKLELALSEEAFDDSRVVKKISNCAMRRRESKMAKKSERESKKNKIEEGDILY